MINEKDFKKMSTNKDEFIKKLMSLVSPQLQGAPARDKAATNKFFNDQSKIFFDKDRDNEQIMADVQALHRKFNRDHAFTDNK